ncbi:hypothetical protein VNO78_04395 [Psophocarpus tetragonolobus]|uniref:Uncharacterized protein n=1 Tax=Psophocarpus tetragonolobus TaxID=3891 RepID=A0AAN9T1U1_PSOTE
MQLESVVVPNTDTDFDDERETAGSHSNCDLIDNYYDKEMTKTLVLTLFLSLLPGFNVEFRGKEFVTTASDKPLCEIDELLEPTAC